MMYLSVILFALSWLASIIYLEFMYSIYTLVGSYALFWWLVDNLKSLVYILKAVLTPYFQPEEVLPLTERYGNWAVITGSTDGIGKEYAKELANKGINIVLISRSQTKLVEVANEIESLYPVKTKWIVADFSQGQKIYEHIKSELAGIQVGLLVNNVGRMYDFPDELGKIPEQLLWDIININIGAVTMMTRMVINDMKLRKKGAIVNISSGSELQPVPYMAVYAASKIYVKSFTLALQTEFAEHGLTIQLVTPMFVKTKMNEYSETVMKGGMLIPTVESYTKSAVFSLGKTDETTGYWSHGAQYAFIRSVPTWIRTIFGMQMNLNFRFEYFANQNKKLRKSSIKLKS